MGLELTYGKLLAQVGFFLGHGRGEDFGDTAWTAQEKAAIQFCVESGLRQFYFPPPVEGTPSAYEWSFLRPVTQLYLLDGDQTVQLPEDFGGVEGNLTISSDQATDPIKLVNEGQIRQQYAACPSTTGKPQLASIRPLKGTSGKGQKKELYVWPTADDDYTLDVTYYILPDVLQNSFPNPYGGAQHAETILESCLAIAEQRLDDAKGVHWEQFRERLLASISADRKMKPQTLGYNADRSDGYARWMNKYFRTTAQVTVNNVLY